MHLLARLSCFVTFAITGSAFAATLNVPGQFASIQAAINAAQANDIIVVQSGVHTPIRITKPLTILGNNLATIRNAPSPGGSFSMVPTVDIQCTGTVRLSRLKIEGQADGGWFSSTAPGIQATGISQLLIEECDVRAPVWFNLTGIAVGTPAIDTTAPYVRVARSFVAGGMSDTDDCNYPFCPNSAPGILAVNSTVVCIDSVVRGGDGAAMCFDLGNCPSNCPCGSLGAAGGAGIVAQRLFHGGPKSDIRGGVGKPVLCGGSNVGKQPDGAKWLVSNHLVDLGTKVTGNASLELGTTSTLTVTGATANSILLVGNAAQPLFVGNPYGYLFLVPTSMTVISFPFIQNFGMTVPNTPALIGADVALQIYDPSFKLSVPFFSVIEP